jgi:hypothetical protein
VRRGPKGRESRATGAERVPRHVTDEPTKLGNARAPRRDGRSGIGVLIRPRQPAHQPQVRPWFCSCSQAVSGAKYSTIAPASIVRVPATASSASGHG